MPPVRDLLEAIDAVDDLLHRAPGVPMGTRRRVDAGELASCVDAISDQAAVLRLERTAAGRDLLQAVAELEALRAEAPSWPGGAVRLDRMPVYDLLDRMRASLPEALRAERLAAMPRIDVAAPDAPTLAGLLDRLAGPDGEHGLRLSRDGEVLGVLHRPPVL